MDYPRDEFNTAITYIVQLILLMASYLDINLPCEMVIQGVKSYTRETYKETTEICKYPLHLEDNNLNDFTMGLSMMAANVAFVCISQDISVELKDIPCIIENIYKCRQSKNLGR
jgi:hypothetical protein